MSLGLKLYRKTGTNTWTEVRGMSAAGSTFDFTGLSIVDLPSGVNALKVDALDDAGNNSSSTVILFEHNNTIRRFNNFKVQDDVEGNTGLISLTTASPWVTINDILPLIKAYFDATSMQSHSENAPVNPACIQRVRIFLAWKPYVDASTTKATINDTSTAMDSLANSTGQKYFDITTGFNVVDDTIEVSVQIQSGAGVELVGGRIYTIGAKWQDSAGNYHPYVPGDERSFVLDTNPPNVAISSPSNGYIYNGIVVNVNGTCTDPVIG